MTETTDTYDENYDEYDEFDDSDDRGLSGFSVLIIGLVMIGAFISVIWIAYQQGIKAGTGDGPGANTPFVSADPEPIKIASADDADPAPDREVYDVFDGDDEEPATVLAEGPEEPVTRTADDMIGEITANVDEAPANTEEIQDRLAGLAEADAEMFDDEPAGEPARATQPMPASANGETKIANTAANALSGTHLVQVGAFRSRGEAETHWARMQTRLGDYVDGRSIDIERADLGERGVYHRLRLGPFSSGDEAKTFCAGLKERGQDCLTRAK